MAEVLNEKEKQALQLYAIGNSVNDIVRQMNYSLGYIKHILETARTKLEAKNTTHAVAIAIKRGLIDFNEE